MNLKDFGETLAKTGLPLLANAIVPGGGAIVSGLAAALGVKDAQPDAIAQAITADPTLIQKAREFEATHQETLINLALQAQKLDNDDRASARQREMSVKGYTNQILAGVIICGYFASFAMLMLYPLPPTMHDPVMMLVGSLISAFTAVVAYYFGSSQGSIRKTELLANRSQ